MGGGWGVECGASDGAGEDGLMGVRVGLGEVEGWMGLLGWSAAWVVGCRIRSSYWESPCHFASSGPGEESGEGVVLG